MTIDLMYLCEKGGSGTFLGGIVDDFHFMFAHSLSYTICDLIDIRQKCNEFMFLSCFLGTKNKTTVYGTLNVLSHVSVVLKAIANMI